MWIDCDYSYLYSHIIVGEGNMTILIAIVGLVAVVMYGLAVN
jgi:hypothetical protein